MMKDVKDLMMGELIGKKVEVIKGVPLGIKGTIIDETKHLFVIQTEQGNKMVQKKQATFRIWEGGKAFDIDGRLLEERPEDRVKL